MSYLLIYFMKLCQTLTKPSLDRFGVEIKVVTKHFENGYKRGKCRQCLLLTHFVSTFQNSETSYKTPGNQQWNCPFFVTLPNYFIEKLSFLYNDLFF